MKINNNNNKNISSKDISSLVKALNNLASKRVVKMYESTWMFIWYNIFRGILTGFGTVLGATVVIAILIHLSQYIINWPIIGDMVKNLLEILQEYNNIKQGTVPIAPPPTSQ